MVQVENTWKEIGALRSNLREDYLVPFSEAQRS